MFGRGLLIVGAVADRWGVTELTVGKLVWCELDVVRGVRQTADEQEPHPAPAPVAAPAHAPTRNRQRHPAARWAS
ncbi:hypothetical protein [Streptomyces sp. NBC_00280]|uniref:hypothetical protein n=1 Tax=Streptomyces sp. NBC_00280 TaxID=2975699 RepID=UPI00324A94B3